ncbi:hypothetical protein QYZ88_018685 (plasmid) [Lachnospiraceae bacterium C1.1]|nr:hypothetical protein [Lachnospiraceae bacterium C1.1]
MIRTGFENFDIISATEPIWMRDERYDYCEDFYSLCNKNNSKILSKLAKLQTLLFSALSK